jgi:hypothetical protein
MASFAGCARPSDPFLDHDTQAAASIAAEILSVPEEDVGDVLISLAPMDLPSACEPVGDLSGPSNGGQQVLNALEFRARLRYRRFALAASYTCTAVAVPRWTQTR